MKAFAFSRNDIQVCNTFCFSLFSIKLSRKLLSLCLMKSYIWFCFRSTFLKTFFFISKGIMLRVYDYQLLIPIKSYFFGQERLFKRYNENEDLVSHPSSVFCSYPANFNLVSKLNLNPYSYKEPFLTERDS